MKPRSGLSVARSAFFLARSAIDAESVRAFTTVPPELSVVSSWLLSGLGLDTVRQQVHGTWSEARLQTCLPRLRRFLCSRPRRRGHQECAVRAWLAQRASPRFDSQQQVA